MNAKSIHTIIESHIADGMDLVEASHKIDIDHNINWARAVSTYEAIEKQKAIAEIAAYEARNRANNEIEFGDVPAGTGRHKEIWEQFDGTEIAVADMSELHLRNVLSMLIREGWITPGDGFGYNYKYDTQEPR